MFTKAKDWFSYLKKCIANKTTLEERLGLEQRRDEKRAELIVAFEDWKKVELLPFTASSTSNMNRVFTDTTGLCAKCRGAAHRDTTGTQLPRSKSTGDIHEQEIL